MEDLREFKHGIIRSSKGGDNNMCPRDDKLGATYVTNTALLIDVFPLKNSVIYLVPLSLSLEQCGPCVGYFSREKENKKVCRSYEAL